MSGVRGMLARVQRLEQARVAPMSPFERWYGSLGAFEAETQARLEAGALDPIDVPLVLAAIRGWHRDGLWGGLRWVPVKEQVR